MPASPTVSRSDLHFWEEPPISGSRGSGTIFFTGCSLGCVFCQNSEISVGCKGKRVSEDELVEMMLTLKDRGAHNINFVTPTHFAPSIVTAVKQARLQGLDIPIIYNTGSYDTAETIKSLFGTVNVYLPDMKYYLGKTSKILSKAENYPETSRAAIDEMVRQVGECRFDENGIIRSGVIVRVLLLPRHVAEAKLVTKYLYDRYGDKIYISLMNQYTPMPNMSPPLDRRVTREEYRELVDYAEKIGVKNAFIQDQGTASDEFIPDFNLK